jgi:drug/metabolite transporter (DMT)-like permease
LIPSLLFIVFLGCNQFLIALLSKEGISVFYAFAVFCFLICAVLKYILIRHRRKKGEVEFNLYSPDSGVKWEAAVGLFFRTAFNAIGLVCWVNGYKYAELACIDRGVMASLMSMFVAWQWIVGYLLFKEPIQIKNVVGTAIIVVSILIGQLP